VGRWDEERGGRKEKVRKTKLQTLAEKLSQFKAGESQTESRIKLCGSTDAQISLCSLKPCDYLQGLKKDLKLG